MPKCPRIDARDILIASLVRIGASGLCYDGCGCGLDDLVSCNNDPSGCVPARKVKVRDLDPDKHAAADYDAKPDDDWYIEMDVLAEVASALGIAPNATSHQAGASPALVQALDGPALEAK